MLTLHVFPGAYGQPSVSPFCTKTMVFMKIAGIEHKAKPGDPRSAPNGKLPCLRHEDGIIPDSGLIQEWLKTNMGADMDADLTAQQQATGHVIRRMLEENLYWILVYSRWIDEAGWVQQKPVLQTMLPKMVRGFLPGILRKGLKKSLHAHGIGRHPQETIYAHGADDLQALEDMIEGPFLFGDKLSSHDINIFAFVGGLYANPASSAIQDKANASPKLKALCEAVQTAYDAA